MPVNTARLPLIHLVLKQRRQETLGRPAFTIRLLRQRRPQSLDGRQAQLRQQHGQGRCLQRAHATTRSKAS